MTFFEYTLPAVRGVQAGREFFVTMCPVKLLPKLFPDVRAELHPEWQGLRVVNEQRVPEIARYVTGHRDSYVLSALTASIDAEVRFSSATREPQSVDAGQLHIPLAGRLLLHDGIHRCLGLIEALSRSDDLESETIPLVIFVDPEFKRSDRIFTDIKRNERQGGRSLGIFHDGRDELASLTREMISRVPVFANSIEMARTAISNRSRKLFTFSALYQATKTLLADRRTDTYEEKLDAAVAYWNEVARRIPAWQRAADGRESPAELRKNYVHVHGIALAALARAGRTLLAERPKGWKRALGKLKSLDWSRSNTELWEGRAMIAGRLSKASSCVTLTGNAVKQHLELPLTDEEQQLERRHKSPRH